MGLLDSLFGNKSVTLKFSVKGLGQPTSSTCWYASYCMMYAFKGQKHEDVLPKLRNKNLKVDEMLKRGLLPEELLPAGQALGVTSVHPDFLKADDYSALVTRLTKSPIWFAMDLTDDGITQPTHAVVIYGADEKLDRVAYYDPYAKPFTGDPEKGWWTMADYKKKIFPTCWAAQVWL